MHRFFLPAAQLRPELTVHLPSLAHQLHAVLRLQPGAQIVLLDDMGQEYLTELRHLDSRRAEGLILSQAPAPAEPALPLTLFQCSLKADKFEWVLQKGTELGVRCFVPVLSRRSIVRPAAALIKRYDRWRSIMREAAEQCGRGRLPQLADPLPWKDAVQAAQGMRLLPWEEHEDAPQTVGLGQAVAAGFDGAATVPEVNLVIGPEGGITAQEVQQARDAGWQVVSLGPRVLRAETAAVAGISIILEHAGELGRAR